MKINNAIILILSIINFLTAQPIKIVGVPIIVSPKDKYFISPKWSPNLKYISVTEPKYNGIYVISLKDKKIHQITDELSAGYKYQWSPDGKFIAAKVNKKQFDKIYSAIKIFEIPSGKFIIIKEYNKDDSGFPLWTKDGKSIYLNFYDQLKMFPVFNKQEQNGYENLIYVKDNKLYLYNPQKDTEINILDQLKIELSNFRIIDTAISPDHNKIAIETTASLVYILSLRENITYKLPDANSVSWSPDSKHLVFCKSTDDGHNFISSDIYISTWDGKNLFQITNTPDKIELSPSWSPDGKWIVYSLFNSGKILIQKITYLEN
ncbi:MAG: PD40 domain-containing protein [Candidatus Marinimicrobia bacterium]|nr:PD40 domain-containing protein [Candidatus Neomarinimicrobiota bacterium]